MKKIRTQKAVGIIKAVPSFAMTFGAYFKEHYLMQSEKDIQDFFSNHNIKNAYFARPCPVTPKHGFVESRKITSKTQAIKLFKDIMKQDPQGELLLGPVYDKVTHNAICVSSGLLSVGPGNDGATGGKDSISIPIAPLTVGKQTRKLARIKEDDAVYVEAIFAKENGEALYLKEDKCNITQLRAGPHIQTSSPDYIPENITVKEVVIPSDDLLLWAKMAANIKPGTVVYGRGHTLSSHAAVHCVIHKIPFITSFTPVVGQKLTKSESKQTPLNREEFRKGVSLILKSKTRKEISDLAKFALATLHNWPYLKNHSEASWMIGAALTSLLKVGTAICQGELRHHFTKRRYSEDRGDIYRDVMFATTHKVMQKLQKAIMMFADGTWEDGFGGIPWSMCAHFMVDLNNAIFDIYNAKSNSIKDSEIAKAIDIYNKIINLEHNNGWWFNKILEKSDFDLAAKQPAKSMLLCAKTLFEMKQACTSKMEVSAFRKITANVTPFIKLDSGELRWLNVYNSGKIKVCSNIRKTEDLAFKLSEADIKIIDKRIGDYGFGFWKTTLPIKGESVLISKNRAIPLKQFGDLV